MPYAGPLKKVQVLKTVYLMVTVERDESFVEMTDDEFLAYVTATNVEGIVEDLMDAKIGYLHEDSEHMNKPGIRARIETTLQGQEWGELS